jgi:hypothetical protein
MKYLSFLIIAIVLIQLPVKGQNLIDSKKGVIPVGVKSVYRNQNQVLINDVYVFSENSSLEIHKKRKILVANAYQNNAYGSLSKYADEEVNLALGLNFKDRFFEITLSDTLQRGEIYTFSMDYNLSETSTFKLSNIPISLSKESVIGSGEFGRKYYKKESLNSNSLLTYKSLLVEENPLEWNESKFEFKAKGGEKYIIIGLVISKKTKNPYQSFSFLEEYSNQVNIQNNFKKHYKKSTFYFLKEIKLTKKNSKVINTSASTYVYDISGFSSYKTKEFTKSRFFLNEELGIEGILFRDSLIDITNSILSLNEVRFALFYEFNSSIIEFKYKTSQKEKVPILEKRLNSLKEYYVNNFDISPLRIIYSIDVSGEYSTKDTRLYLKILSF